MELTINQRVNVVQQYVDDKLDFWPGIVKHIIRKKNSIEWLILEVDSAQNGGCEALLLKPHNNDTWAIPLDDGWETGITIEIA